MPGRAALILGQPPFSIFVFCLLPSSLPKASSSLSRSLLLATAAAIAGTVSRPTERDAESVTSGAVFAATVATVPQSSFAAAVGCSLSRARHSFPKLAFTAVSLLLVRAGSNFLESSARSCRRRRELQLFGVLVDRWPKLSGNSRFQHSRFTESMSGRARPTRPAQGDFCPHFRTASLLYFCLLPSSFFTAEGFFFSLKESPPRRAAVAGAVSRSSNCAPGLLVRERERERIFFERPPHPPLLLAAHCLELAACVTAAWLGSDRRLAARRSSLLLHAAGLLPKFSFLESPVRSCWRRREQPNEEEKEGPKSYFVTKNCVIVNRSVDLQIRTTLANISKNLFWGINGSV
ncbi:hypothetical protein M9H77_19492 [Catharanthus roseus]|uniref:Uncharacterized protein n=1 Tax=Catharanthus roseus TaxID=4058 RepID=A0ACC0BAJ7_CATRO|nr:hypothetical protein M9H77_19492 [Catharanthus roseus]